MNNDYISDSMNSDYVAYGPSIKFTIDGEWDEEELKGDVFDEVYKYYNENNVQKKYQNKALYDRDMLKPQYMIEEIQTQYDLIEEYNRQYDKRKSEKKFGIVYFDEWLNKEILKILRDNLVR